MDARRWRLGRDLIYALSLFVISTVAWDLTPCQAEPRLEISLNSENTINELFDALLAIVDRSSSINSDSSKVLGLRGLATALNEYRRSRGKEPFRFHLNEEEGQSNLDSGWGLTPPRSSDFALYPGGVLHHPTTSSPSPTPTPTPTQGCTQTSTSIFPQGEPLEFGDSLNGMIIVLSLQDDWFIAVSGDFQPEGGYTASIEVGFCF